MTPYISLLKSNRFSRTNAVIYFVWIMFGMCSAFKCLQDHPVVCVFNNDKEGIKNAYAKRQSEEAAQAFKKNETSNPVADKKSEDDETASAALGDT